MCWHCDIVLLQFKSCFDGCHCYHTCVAYCKGEVSGAVHSVSVLLELGAITTVIVTTCLDIDGAI